MQCTPRILPAPWTVRYRFAAPRSYSRCPVGFELPSHGGRCADIGATGSQCTPGRTAVVRSVCEQFQLLL
ncbi:hypothetical protein GS429_14880 [Natronorubrum sp. JWXQ-INN-674]|uniref:Uncharacterized protein n=1 Tax=Natronorubrum halalkaliphilum TaxID=2691917 RepID=A0A6B0VQQ1_9EURY|nr:hypothetical protein [Natronorubrum halalkaliphilum]